MKTALLLTAGLGERLRPVTNHLAKPAIPFLNTPLLTFGMHWLAKMGVSKVVCNLHHLPETVKIAALNAAPNYRMSVDFSDETAQILGSGGAIFHARNTFITSSNFVYLNADEVMIPSSSDVPKKFVDAHMLHQPLATILVTRHPEAGKSFGAVMADKQGVVHGFSRPPIGPKFQGLIPYHFTGMQIFSETLFEYARPGVSNIFYDILVQAIADGQTVRIFEDQCQWFETGNLKDFLSATENVLNILRGPSEIASHSAATWLSDILKLKERGIRFSNSLLSFTSSLVDNSVEVKNFAVVDENITIAGSGSLNRVVFINPSKTPKTFSCTGEIRDQILVL